MSPGRVYLVGAGPGDPGLITVRGREVLSKADVVLYDYLASRRLLDYAPTGAELIYVGKRASDHAIAQDEIERLLIDKARSGATVVRLKGGDPFVFGRGGEEALALAAAGVPFEVVPGVTAAVAAAAYSGIPLTHRDLSSAVAFVTGHEAPGKDASALDWPALAAWKGTLAFYMGVENLDHISSSLIAHGLSGETPAAAIHCGTTPRQKVVAGTLSGLPQAARAAGLRPPAIIVIGQTVTLGEKLRWFESRPLFGRRIVVTRARKQASEISRRLEEYGAEVIEMPVIRIEPPDDSAPLAAAVARLNAFDWILFTSVHGVDAFFSALISAGLDSRALAHNRVASIGPATAERIATFGIRADLLPAEFSSARLADALSASATLSGARILCPRSDVAPDDLLDALGARGAVVSSVVAYKTVPETSGVEDMAAMLSRDELNWLTFTSSSTVKNFFSLISPGRVQDSSLRIASIGPVTSAAIRALGLEPAAEAHRYTIPGLVDAILHAEAAPPGLRPPGLRPPGLPPTGSLP